jgi:hypothetical protein
MTPILKTFDRISIVILSVFFLSLISCNDDGTDLQNTETVSDFLDDDIAAFGRTMSSNFDKHVEAINAIGSDDVSVSDALEASYQVNLEHYPDLDSISPSDLNQLEDHVSENGVFKSFHPEMIDETIFSDDVKTELTKLYTITTNISSYESYQEELLNYTRQIKNSSLSDSERRVIMLHIVSVYHGGEYLYQYLSAQNGSSRFDLLGAISCGLSTISGAAYGAVEGTIAGSTIGGGVGSVAGAVVGCVTAAEVGCVPGAVEGAKLGSTLGSAVGSVVGAVVGAVAGGASAASSSC